jgi:hypothetical protein
MAEGKASEKMMPTGADTTRLTGSCTMALGGGSLSGLHLICTRRWTHECASWHEQPRRQAGRGGRGGACARRRARRGVLAVYVAMRRLAACCRAPHTAVDRSANGGGESRAPARTEVRVLRGARSVAADACGRAPRRNDIGSGRRHHQRRPLIVLRAHKASGPLGRACAPRAYLRVATERAWLGAARRRGEDARLLSRIPVEAKGRAP